MAETPFKIKTGIKLDTSKAEADLKKFTENNKNIKDIDIQVKLDYNDVLTGLKSIKEEIDKINKTKVNISADTSELKDNYKKAINDVQKQFENTELINPEQAINSKEIIAKYKDVFSTISKLNKQLSSGINDDVALDSFAKIDELGKQLDKLRKRIKPKDLELFDFKQDNSEIVDINKQILNLTNNVEKLDKNLKSVNFKTVDTSYVEDSLTNFLKIISQLDKYDNVDISITVNDLKNKMSDIDTVIKNLKELETIKNDFNKLSPDIKSNLGEDYFKEIETQITKIENSVKSVDGTFTAMSSVVKNTLKETKNAIKVEAKNIENELKESLKVDKAIGNFEEQFKKLEKSFNSINFKNVDTSDIVNKIKELSEHIDNLKKTSNDEIDIEVDINKALSEVKELKDVIKNLKDFDKLKGIFDEIGDSVKNTLGKDYVSKLESQLNELEDTVYKVDGSFERLSSSMKDSFSEAISDIKLVQNEMKQASKITEDFGNVARSSINNGFIDNFKSSFTAYTLGDIAGDTVINTIRGITDAYIEMDAAITNIKKVADENDINSVDKLENIKNTAIDVAKEVGKSSSEVMNAIADTLQAGIGNMQTSIDVAKQTMMLANVGDIDQETASSAVNTMINGFNIDAVTKFKKEINGTQVEVTELTQTMDALNHASNNYGTDTQKLLDGLQNGATVLGSYGVSIEDTIALMTAGIEVLGNGNKVGNSLKSIAINMAGISTSAKDGTLTLNKTAKSLEEIAGIDIFEDRQTGQVKDMVTILDELQAKWHTFTEEEQLGLANAIAGEQLPS